MVPMVSTPSLSPWPLLEQLIALPCSGLADTTCFWAGRGPEGGKLPAKVRAQAEKKLESARAALEREKTKSGSAPAPSDRGRL